MQSALGLLAVGGLLLAGCTGVTPLSPAGEFAYELSLATNGQQRVAAWHGGPTGNAIWIRRTNAVGAPLGVPLRLTSGTADAYEPDLQLQDGDVIVAWYERDPNSGAMTAQLGRFTVQGQARWRRTLSGPDVQGRNPVVRLHGEAALVAWIETPTDGVPAIWTARVGVDGTFIESPLRGAPADKETWNLNAAVDDRGTFYVVYDARRESRAKEVHLLTVGPDGVTQRRLTADDGHESVYPDIAIGGADAALTWYDTVDGNPEVYLHVGAATQLASGEVPSVRMTRTRGASTGAYVAWRGDRLGLAWCEDIGGQSEIFFAQFDAHGARLGAARRVTHTATQSAIPAIRAARHGFALAWNEYESTTADGRPKIVTSRAVMTTIR